MMSKQEKQDTKNVKPVAETATGKAKAKPWEFHARYLDYLRESLKAEGEQAYSRWGISTFHCLSDEEIEAQRLELGFELKDGLDYYNRGCLLAIREDYAQACPFFVKAIEASPELAEARFNYAICLESMGELDKARSVWQEYLDQYACPEEVEDIKQHLGSLASA